MNLGDSLIAGRRSPSDPGGDRPVRGGRFTAASPNGSGLTVGSTSVLGLRATPGDEALDQRSEIDRGVLVPVDDQAAGGAYIGAFGQGSLVFTTPQAEQVFEDGYQRSATTRVPLFHVVL
jgi:hypothetical protein